MEMDHENAVRVRLYKILNSILTQYSLTNNKSDRALSLQGNLRISFNENVSEVEIGEMNTDKEVRNTMMEEKIKSFGAFSGDISMVLMMLMKDNEKFKSLIQTEFEEIEIRMNDLSEKIEAEKKERETEIANIHHALSAHNYEIEALRNKVTDVETLNNTMMNGIGKYQIFDI